MEKKSRYPIFLIGHKNGIVSKIKSTGELNTYIDKSRHGYTEVDHYPTKEEIEKILESIREEKK